MIDHKDSNDVDSRQTEKDVCGPRSVHAEEISKNASSSWVRA